MEISITRGLAELKTLNARISKAINEPTYITFVTGKKVPTGFKDTKEFEDKVKSGFQSVQDLIKRRNEIKAAIVQSNAVTKVKIADDDITVAGAIERKSSIALEQELLVKLKTEYNKVVRQYEAEEQKVKDRLDDLLSKNFEKDVKATPEQYKAVSDPFMEQNQPKLIDPLNIKNEIEKLEKNIEDFLLNVDFVLSESNTTQKIEVV